MKLAFPRESNTKENMISSDLGCHASSFPQYPIGDIGQPYPVLKGSTVIFSLSTDTFLSITIT